MEKRNKCIEKGKCCCSSHVQIAAVNASGSDLENGMRTSGIQRRFLFSCVFCLFGWFLVFISVRKSEVGSAKLDMFHP